MVVPKKIQCENEMVFGNADNVKLYWEICANFRPDCELDMEVIPFDDLSDIHQFIKKIAEYYQHVTKIAISEKEGVEGKCYAVKIHSDDTPENIAESGSKFLSEFYKQMDPKKQSLFEICHSE